MRRLALPLTLAFATVAVVLALLPWAQLFLTSVGGGPPLPVLIAGVLVALVVSVVTISVAKWRFAGSVGASAITFVVYCLLAVVEPRFSVSSFLDGYTGAVDRVLTSVPPLLVTGGVLVPIMTLGWLVTASTTELVLRTKSVGLLLVGPAALLLVAQLVATRPSVAEPGLATQLWLPLAVFACLALVVVFRHQSLDVERIGEPSASERRAMVLTPVVAGLLVLFTAAVALGATDLVPGSSDEASLERQPPVDQSSSSGPVETFSALRNPTTVFAQPYHCEVPEDCAFLRVEGLPGGRQYVGLVALTDYDGASWLLPEESLFLPTGLEIPGNVPAGRATVDQTYEVVRPLPDNQPWLASITQPTEVLGLAVQGAAATEVLVEPSLGALRSPVPLTAGDTYRVRSVQAQGSIDDVDDEEPILGTVAPPPEATRRQVNVAVSATARQWFAALGLDPTNPFPDVSSFKEVVRTMASAGIDPATGPESVKGSRSLSLSGLDNSFPLNEERTASPTAEQVATQLAVLARGAGLPSRVVVGFRSDVQSGQPVSLGAREQWTWAEVFIGNVGWVVLDPEASAQLTPPTTEPEGVGEDEETTPSTSDVLTPPRVPPAASSPGAGPGSLVAVVVLLLLLGVVTILLAALGHRRRRWARRQQGEPVERVLGAWHELLDRLDESRSGPLRASTGSEVVAAVRERHGDEVAQPVGNVATLADPAVFSARTITSPEAEAAWRNLDAARRALSTRLTLGQRLVAFLRSLRPQRFRRT